MGRWMNATRSKRHAAYHHHQEVSSAVAGAHAAAVAAAGHTTAAAAAAAGSTAAGQSNEVYMAAATRPRLAAGADSEDDEEAAEFSREAAELLKHKQRKTTLPGGLQQKQLDNAIKHFVGQTGISIEEAKEALLATAEQYCSHFEEWMNEAQVWLAVQGEVQDEAAKLKEAMEVSLREQQAAREAEKAAAPPLVNLSEERLRQRFGGSSLLQHLSNVLPGSVLFCDRAPLREQVKHKFVEFLRLEANCLKWWPDAGTRAYFDKLAERFCQQVSQASSGGNSAAAASPAGTTAGTDPAGQHLAHSCAQNIAAPHPTTMPGTCMAGTSAAGHAAGSSRGAGASAAAVPSAGVLVAPGDGVGTCRQTPEGERLRLSEPSSTAASDSPEDNGGTGGNSGEPRVSKRKRQPPARFRSPSPAAAELSKKQRLVSPDCGPPCKRQPSADSYVAAGRMAGHVASTEQPGITSAGVAGPSATDALVAGASGAGYPQDKGAVQQVCGSLLPLQQQQQQVQCAVARPPQQQQQVLLQQAAVSAGACTAVQACMAVCLSQLLDDELQHLKHHVFNMPEKACAVPAIFQSAEALQQQDEGDDSDVELVDVKLPQAKDSLPEAPESPLSPPTRTPAATAAPVAPGGVAAAAALAALGSTVPPHAADMEALLRAHGGAATAAAAAMPWLPPPPAAAGGGAMYMQTSMTPPSAGGIPGIGSYGAVDTDEWQYRSSTNEQGTLVIEID